MNATAAAQEPALQPGDHVRIHHLASHPLLADERYELYEVAAVESDSTATCDEPGCDGLTLRVRSEDGEADWLHVHRPEIEVVTDLVARMEDFYAGDALDGDRALLGWLQAAVQIATRVSGHESYHLAEVRLAIEQRLTNIEPGLNE